MRNITCFGLADQTTDFNRSLSRTTLKGSNDLVLFLYLKNTRSEKNSTMNVSEFSELLKLQNVSQLKNYLKAHRLSESDEYQMVVTLAMELDDEKAEKIICGYIYRYGLCSQHSRQVLKDLDFKKALNILYAQDKKTKSDKVLDLCDEHISVHQKLRDGFEMMRDDENLSI